MSFGLLTGMKGERDSFVFYRSFREPIALMPEDDQLAFFWDFIDCCLGDKELSDVPYPRNAIMAQMLSSVSIAKARYEKSVENGAKGGEKGGRPKKWIAQEEAEALYAELKNWKAVADALEVDEDTLRKLRYAWDQKAEKPKNRKNPNVNVNDNDNVNANVNDNVIISNNKNTGSNKETSKVPVLPELGEGERWISEPYKMRNGTWIADYEDLDGEVRCKVLGEP